MSQQIENLKEDLEDIATKKLNAANRVKTLVGKFNFLLFLKRAITENHFTVEEIADAVSNSDICRLERMFRVVMNDHRFQTVVTLRKRCRDLGIAYFANMTKEEMIAALEKEDRL